MDNSSIVPNASPMRAPQSFLPLKNDVLYICLAIAARPRHGYAIIRDVEERSDRQVLLQTGAFYRTLRTMLTGGLIEECAPPVGETVDDNRRRYYQLTTLGTAVLEAELERLEELVRTAQRVIASSKPRLA